MIDFHFDFETRSRVDLKKLGAMKYATDPSTEATLLTWCFGRSGQIKAWRLGQPIPQEIIHVAEQPEKFNFIAHNVLFDYLIWTIPFKRLIPSMKAIPLSNITDNMALAHHNRLGSSLNSCAAMCGLPVSKDPEGRRIMLKQCKPNGRTKEFPTLTEEEWSKFEYYGIIDTKLLRETYYKMNPLPTMERWAFEWTFRRNLLGIKIDLDLLSFMKETLDREKPILEKEFEHIVGYQFKVNQRAKCLEWFQQYYPHMKDMQKGTVRDTLLGTYRVPHHARRALEIKSIVGSTSLAKVDVLDRMNVGGRIYGTLNYAKAHTKRWAGMGVQIQNFPRPSRIDFLDLEVEDLATAARNAYALQDDGVQFVKNLLRRVWKPDDGLLMYCGDFSKIEPTVLFWLTGIGPIPKLWYEEMAAEIYMCDIKLIGKDSEERQLGKNTALGSGYGMGPDKFVTQIKEQSGTIVTKDLAKKAIYAYRKKYWQVPEFWRFLEWGFRTAIGGQAAQLCGGKVIVMPIGEGRRGVKIRIPSGNYLYYPNAHIKTDEKGQQSLAYTSTFGDKPVVEHLYGGLLCEHVVSSTARDIMLNSMKNMEEAGFPILTTIHDEVWASAEPNRDKEFADTMCQLPVWAGDMVVTVDAMSGHRYLK